MIPVKLKEDLNKDPFYKKCCLTGRTDGKICFHHNLIFAGKQVQEKFAILPVIEDIHKYHRGLTSEVKEKLNWIMLNRATDTQLKMYSKATDYIAMRDRLNKKYNTRQ